MRYHASQPAMGPRSCGNTPYHDRGAGDGLLLPVLFAGAMSLGANMAAVRAQTMSPGRAVLDAVVKGSAAVLIAGAGMHNRLGRAAALAMLFGAGYAIGAITNGAATGAGRERGIQP